jgi:hypothetical protein
MANKKVRSSSGNFVLDKLVQIQNPIVPFEENELEQFFSDVEEKEAAEAVKEEKDSCPTNKITLEEYLEKVRNLMPVGSRSPLQIESDILDYLKPLKINLSIPISRLIECIVSDWIELHYEELEAYRYIEKKKNKYEK